MEGAHVSLVDALKTARDSREDSREDYAAVAARAEQHSVRGKTRSLAHGSRFVRESNYARVDRQKHIVARVAVGDREHVKIVDLLDLIL